MAAIAASLAVSLATSGWAAERLARDEARAALAAEAILRHVEVLASDALEGREAGSRGGYAAGGYLVDQLRQTGLAPAGQDGGWFQLVPGGGRNVLALLAGSDPALADQVIVVGAHYDHVGRGTARTSYGPLGRIHNGADDNASGTAALLDVARVMSRLSTPPRRSVLFAWWDAEEIGLIGSRHWVSQPTVPLRRIVAAINVDMIGRMRGARLEVFGTRTAYEMRRLVSRSNREAGIELAFPWRVEENSDHWPFWQAGVPILMLHTGLHEDYHRPSDEVEKLNTAGLVAAARLLLGVVDELANRDDPPRFRPASRHEASGAGRRELERPATAPTRLGIVWRRDEPAAGSAGAAGLIVTRVLDGSAAQRAGIRPNDRIVRLQGEPIGDDDAFRIAVLEAAGALTLDVVRSGGGDPQAVRVALAGAPMRLGFNWREDEAEPTAALVVHVAPGSRAARAGLRVHDRIHRVGERPYVGGDELRRLLVDSPLPLELEVERRGRVSTLKIE